MTMMMLMVVVMMLMIMIITRIGMSPIMMMIIFLKISRDSGLVFFIINIITDDGNIMKGRDSAGVWLVSRTDLCQPHWFTMMMMMMTMTMLMVMMMTMMMVMMNILQKYCFTSKSFQFVIKFCCNT